MKLRNKRTGEIIEVLEKPSFVMRIDSYSQGEVKTFNSLAELNEVWEDAPEEPKEYWYIISSGEVCSISEDEEDEEDTKVCKEIGNYFETRKEAEQAVRKLKAWKRLKDTYFIRFDLDFVKNIISFTYRIDGTLHSSVDEERIVFEDLKTIFGGK